MVNFPYDGASILIWLCMPLLLQLQLLLYPMQVSSYVPADDFAVNCGDSGEATSYDRKWVGDIDPTLFSTHESQSVHTSLTAEAQSPRPPSVNGVPLFWTARLFRSRFTYSFPLKTNGPKFLRLHFYPATYVPNFETHNFLFSVRAANFTLLKDFNASLWLLYGEDTFFIEYCINVVEPGQRLNITFIPSTNYYAFINGIEVVSMPPFLYYTNISKDSGFELVDSKSNVRFQLEAMKALENLYRVNVGVQPIPPAEDTGMFRNWDPDFRYLESGILPQSEQTNWGSHPKYTNDVPNYTAPEKLYLSARTYGKNDEKANYNVTWTFEVDSLFVYMVRLHFCVWGPIQQYGDLIFRIFIHEIIAEEYFSVIGSSGGNLVPTYRDYALLMQNSEGSSKKVKLSIKLQPLPSGVNTRISDVILNGIEIFKISDASNNLAGPNPNPQPVPSPPLGFQVQPLTKSSKSSKKIIAIVAVAAVSGLMLASLIGVIVFSRRGRSHKEEENTKKTTDGSSSLPSHLCRYFTIAEIRAATNNFDDVFIVGVGGFGNVYKGYIDGSTPVAIKRLNPGSQQGINEFLNEIEMLSQLRHLHLVSLIGYCNDGAEMILVYDFMQRGTLREYLYGSDNKPLLWKQRLEILLGAARGLHYLHTGAKHNIIHRDVKSTNILLDEKWVAKVSDFGLSKVGPTGMSTTHVSTIVKGSLGYLDPEYYKRQRLTLKSDVYSFGVVLLEVLCARPPLLRNVDKHKQSVVDWVWRCHDEGRLDQTVDPFLRDSMTPDVLKSYGQLALSCLCDDGNQRPSMGDVVGELEFALQLVETEESVGFGGSKVVEKIEEGPLLPKYTSDEESVLFTSTSGDESGSKNSKMTSLTASTEEESMHSALVFSEIGDPKAR